MVTLTTIDEQLKQAGCQIRGWGRSEVRELCDILLPGETVAAAVNGQYDAGFGLLVATDFRVLLIDKKPKYLTLKDVRFDMITELDFAGRLMDSTVRIYTPNRDIRFTSFNTKRLRKLFQYTQHKVMEIRHHFMMQQFQQQHLANNTPPGVIMAMQGKQDQHYGQAIDVTAMNSSRDEQTKLAAAMGAAGLQSIVHNGRVVKDYMTVPFTQRWRKRPYGYTNTPARSQ
jgi:hypothetical protein